MKRRQAIIIFCSLNALRLHLDTFRGIAVAGQCLRERQVWRLRHVAKRVARLKPWVDPEDAALAAEELARREAVAAAAAEALLNVSAILEV